LKTPRRSLLKAGLIAVSAPFALALRPLLALQAGKKAAAKPVSSQIPFLSAPFGGVTPSVLDPNALVPPATLYHVKRVQDLIENEEMLKGLKKLLYQHIQETIKAALQEDPPYNPYLYEMLFSDVAKLLDRCLSYRRECADLEALAVRRALEFDLFEDLHKKQLQLQTLLASTKALEKESEAFAAASNDFAPQAPEKGFRTLYGRSVDALSEQRTVEMQKGDISKAVLLRSREHQLTLQSRHTTRGHALNYIERRARLIALLVQDIREAYQKARAAKAGLEAQLKITSEPAYPFPALKEDERDVDFLDAFVLWARSVAHNYEIATKDEVQFDLVLPLVHPWTADLLPVGISPTNPKRLVEAEIFNAAMKTDGKLTFSLRNALPTEAQVKNLRVRAVGISIGVSQDYWTNYPIWTSKTWSCVIIPPAQRDPLRQDPTAQLKRDPVIIGRAGIYRGDVVAQLNSGTEVWNVDPRTEDWTVVVNRLMNAPYGNINWVWPRNSDQITDIKLHLRLTGEPARQADRWIPT
jgi:hypothetical protein